MATAFGRVEERPTASTSAVRRPIAADARALSLLALENVVGPKILENRAICLGEGDKRRIVSVHSVPFEHLEPIVAGVIMSPVLLTNQTCLPDCRASEEVEPSWRTRSLPVPV
jgi:hypothetical protein